MYVFPVLYNMIKLEEQISVPKILHHKLYRLPKNKGVYWILFRKTCLEELKFTAVSNSSSNESSNGRSASRCHNVHACHKSSRRTNTPFAECSGGMRRSGSRPGRCWRKSAAGARRLRRGTAGEQTVGRSARTKAAAAEAAAGAAEAAAGAATRRVSSVAEAAEGRSPSAGI